MTPDNLTEGGLRRPSADTRPPGTLEGRGSGCHGPSADILELGTRHPFVCAGLAACRAGQLSYTQALELMVELLTTQERRLRKQLEALALASPVVVPLPPDLQTRETPTPLEPERK